MDEMSLSLASSGGRWAWLALARFSVCWGEGRLLLVRFVPFPLLRREKVLRWNKPPRLYLIHGHFLFAVAMTTAYSASLPSQWEEGKPDCSEGV